VLFFNDFEDFICHVSKNCEANYELKYQNRDQNITNEFFTLSSLTIKKVAPETLTETPSKAPSDVATKEYFHFIIF